MNEKNDFEFLPRPEARATDWDQLLPPLRDAVRDLLLRLEGATAKVVENEEKQEKQEDRAESEEPVTNCFLVYGDRGSGKTTVLLSAQKAVDHKTDFFGKDSNEHPDAEKRDNARDSAGKLKDRHVEWLDVLDLEPLPPEANLLTTLLTRIRDALDKDKDSPRHTGPTSLFEEGEHSARQRLEQLIKDATLMWEDIAEQDTRGRANREVAAADIYAGFRKRFHDALHTLSHELGRRRGTDGMPPIILPIDNVDRSSDHLRSMIKLAEMVSCHHLWLVMAGDRVDLETFLERAYWKELIRVGAGAGGSGKTGPRGEDETFVMARRQAAAASQKLLPPSHRIEVQRVKAEETLRFWLGHGCVSEPDRESETEQTIYNLLRDVELPTKPTPADPLRFIDLLDASRFLPAEVSGGHRPTPDLKLTFAAKHALWLPARNVIDLWQLAHWVQNDHQSFYRKAKSEAIQKESDAKDGKLDFRAEKIARTMLRYVITPSDMTSELGRRLQDRIIGRNVDGGTLLDFYKSPLKVDCLITLEEELRRNKPAEGSNWVVRSRLVLNRIGGVILQIGKKTQSSEAGGSHAVRTRDYQDLPPLVGAWLTILHDIVALATKSSVISSELVKTAPFVEVTHNVVSRTDTAKHTCWVQANTTDGFRWRAPAWRMFLAHEIFRQKWHGCLTNLAPGVPILPDALGPPLISCWVACVLETFATFMPNLTKQRDKGPPTETTLTKTTLTETTLTETTLTATTLTATTLTENPLTENPLTGNPLTRELGEITRDLGKKLNDLKEKEIEGRSAVFKNIFGPFSSKVFAYANKLYTEVKWAEEQFSAEEGAAVVNQWAAMMRDWFELQLPLLLSYPYSPFSQFEGKWKTDGKQDELVNAWAPTRRSY